MARVDGRKGIDGLATIVRSQFAEDPLSGAMYVFFTRRCDRVRVLYFDRDGYVLITKRLEKGTYRVPWADERGRVVIEAAELLLVLEGIELKGARRRERWLHYVARYVRGEGGITEISSRRASISRVA